MRKSLQTGPDSLELRLYCLNVKIVRRAAVIVRDQCVSNMSLGERVWGGTVSFGHYRQRTSKDYSATWLGSCRCHMINNNRWQGPLLWIVPSLESRPDHIGRVHW